MIAQPGRSWHPRRLRACPLVDSMKAERQHSAYPRDHAEKTGPADGPERRAALGVRRDPRRARDPRVVPAGGARGGRRLGRRSSSARCGSHGRAVRDDRSAGLDGPRPGAAPRVPSRRRVPAPVRDRRRRRLRPARRHRRRRGASPRRDRLQPGHAVAAAPAGAVRIRRVAPAGRTAPGDRVGHRRRCGRRTGPGRGLAGARRQPREARLPRASRRRSTPAPPTRCSRSFLGSDGSCRKPNAPAAARA